MRFTPETMFILVPAIFIDLCGLGLVIFGLDDFGILDILGICIVFPWMLFNGGSSPSISDIRAKRGNMEKMRKLFTDKKTKFALPLLGELAPWIGGVGFFWTMSVISNLKNNT